MWTGEIQLSLRTLTSEVPKADSVVERGGEEVVGGWIQGKRRDGSGVASEVADVGIVV